MSAFFFTALSGWALVMLTAALIALPFLSRRNLPVRIARRFGLTIKHSRPFLQRMRPHYWLGYFVAGVTVAHAWVPMSADLARGANVLGLYLATGALFLIFGQIMLGMTLRDPKLTNRKRLRRWHFAMMTGIVALGIGHIALNSPTLHSLFTLLR